MGLMKDQWLCNAIPLRREVQTHVTSISLVLASKHFIKSAEEPVSNAD